MEKLKNKNTHGITLIALIITIIVMLILVGVTINVALNGGLFKTAQNAATNTIIEAEREQLLSAIVASYDEKTAIIVKSRLETNLGTGWNVVGNEGGPYTVTSPKGNVFTVDKNGKIDGPDPFVEYEYTLAQIRELALDSNNGGQIDEETDEDTGNKTINIILPFSAFWKEGTPDSIRNGVERDDMDTAGYYKYEVTVENLPYIDILDYNGGERGLVFSGISPEVAKDGLSFETTENCILIIADQLTDSDDYSQIKIKIKKVKQETPEPEPEPEFNTFTLENLVDAGTVRVDSENNKRAYFDIPIDDFNTIIGQDIRKLNGYLCKLNSESFNTGAGTAYDFYGYIRTDFENTDINIYDATDAVVVGLLTAKKCPDEEIGRTDKKLKWMLENASTAAEAPITYLSLLKNKETNEEIIELAVMESGEWLYHSKEEIPENVLKVTLKPISSKKVNELIKKYNLSE